MVIGKIDNLKPEDRHNILRGMDKIVRTCCDLYPIYSVWDKYGAGRKATEDETNAWREEIVNDDEKFNDALYAFAVCLLFDPDWLDFVLEGKQDL